MPDFAKVQDASAPCTSPVSWSRAKRSFSSFRISTARCDQHIERLVERCRPTVRRHLRHVDDPPATPVPSNPQRAIKWLKHHVREPIDTYFAYEDASVQDIKAAAVRQASPAIRRRAPC